MRPWELLDAYGPAFLEAYWTTILICVQSFVLAGVVGVLIASLRISSIRLLRVLGAVYVEAFRNIPLLVLIIMIYLGFGQGAGLSVSAWNAGVSALGLYTAAYIAEVIRAGILTVAPGQYDAAHSLGFSPISAFFRLVLPQAFRSVIPPFASVTIAMIKNASIVGASLLALGDLLYVGRVVSADTFRTNEAFMVAGAGYLSLTVGATIVFRLLEKRWSVLR